MVGAMDDVGTSDSDRLDAAANSDGRPPSAVQEQAMNSQENSGEGLSAHDSNTSTSQQPYSERQRHPGGYSSLQELEPENVAEGTHAQPSSPKDPTIPDIPSADERQCRICLAGSEEEGDLGPLIRPCKCKGSISVRTEPYCPQTA